MTDTNDASEIQPGTFEGMNAEFSSFEEIHASERHIVWKAKRYNRWWILKGLPPKADTEANRAALRKELEIMMLLPSGGFPQAYGLEKIDDYGPCIVIEYIEGETLAEWLMGKHTAGERRRMALSLMEIVERLHSCGIVSRDIKPSNIIVTKLSGRPVLIDFDLSDTSQHTVFKQPAGTAGYVSPEQAAGFMPDRRNDIYSLAKVVLEMRPPRLWRPTLRRCLKNIEHRVPDAGQLSRRLMAISRIPRTVAVVLTICMVAGIAVWLGQKPAEIVTKVVTIPADTHKIDSLNHEIMRLRDTLESNRLAVENRNRLIREETRKAVGWVKRVWYVEVESNPDAKSFNNEAVIGAFEKLARGMDSIRNEIYKRLEPAEYTVVEAEMNKAYADGVARWKESIEKK